MARYVQYVPVALLIVGFLLIGLGWNGAAGVDYPQGQIPYMISGGLIGLGFVFFGAASLLVQQVKKGQARQLEELEKLTVATQRMASMLSFTSNGHTDTQSHELVIAGGASFHAPSCRLVQRKQRITKIPRVEAVESGLEPCRVCNP